MLLFEELELLLEPDERLELLLEELELTSVSCRPITVTV